MRNRTQSYGGNIKPGIKKELQAINSGTLSICSFTDKILVSPRIFLRNSLEEDLLVLYKRLTDLGMEYRDGKM
jgi:hypothetical protein